jgi:hypothetical protein
MKKSQFLVRKYFKIFNLNMCFLLLIEYRRDICEATHSYVYLLYPKLFILSSNNMCYYMLKVGTFLYLFYIF